MRTTICILLVIFTLNCCRQKAGLSGIISISQTEWEAGKPVEMILPIKKIPKKGLNFCYQVSIDPNFPWENIWLRYFLIGPKGDTLESSTDNLFLFEPGTGKPLGIGNNHCLYVNAFFIQNKRLKEAGNYRFLLSHQMRTDTLRGIQNIGVRISEAE